jgi:hypothetical protein
MWLGFGMARRISGDAVYLSGGKGIWITYKTASSVYAAAGCFNLSFKLHMYDIKF